MANQRIVLTTNYDFAQLFQLWNTSGTTKSKFDMSNATKVSGALIDPNDNEVMLAETNQADSGNADWSTSLVEIVFSNTLTTALQTALTTKYGDVECELLLEIRVNRPSGETAWRYKIAVEQGFITA